MKFEILAPAGSRESLVAGVRCGANAVYLGGKALNARRNAGNFNDDELKEAVAYCHARGVKVYLTVNTLCKDGELEQAYDLVKCALKCGVDAFIIQDIGVIKMISECFPEARLHASTQMSVMTPEGFKALAAMGIARAVLPREMTAEEIFEIRKSTDMELEIFVHGALCMSVSGQCCLSAMIGQRSGNRGLCAQPCRLSFSADNSGSFDLSLKDLSLIKRLKEIGSLGIVSLKIEGRMKRPEYVAAAVTAVKKAIDGDYSHADEKVLKSIFSRSGFTQGYFDNARDKSMFGVRQKEDVVAAKPVLKELSHLYDNENPLMPMDIEFECVKDKPVRLVSSALGKTAKIVGEIPEAAINKPMTEEGLRERLSKLGGTQFFARSVDITLDEGLIVPVSKINSMRREAVKKLSAVETCEPVCLPMPVIPPRSGKTKPYFTARFSSAEQIPDKHPFKRVFIPIWSSAEDFIDNSAGVELPRGLFGKEQMLAKRLEELKKIGVKYALCGNLGAYRLAEKMGFKVYGDFGLNVFNSISASKINSPILSFELTLDEANRINANDTGLIAYGRLPLMLTRNCPVKNNIGCEKCKKRGALTDRKGARFPVVCSPYPCVEILNSVPLYMADRLHEIKTDFVHFYFTDEEKSKIEKIISLYEKGEKANFDFTRGLYYRGVF
ncbi:MAG: U32 family peptidase [Eubacterium sp.]|nr:U32 family peptidase [Eubacterium sp.]